MHENLIRRNQNTRRLNRRIDVLDFKKLKLKIPKRIWSYLLNIRMQSNV